MISIIIAVIVVIIDQITKLVVAGNMELGSSISIIDGVLNITYIHNNGGIFGSMSGSTPMLLVMSALIVFLLCFVIYKYHGQSKIFDVCLGLMLGGGIGNIIDRIYLGKVIDFIDFCAFDFWTYIFNIADCAVVLGCILAIIFVAADSKNTIKLNKEVKDEIIEAVEDALDSDDHE